MALAGSGAPSMSIARAACAHASSAVQRSEVVTSHVPASSSVANTPNLVTVLPTSTARRQDAVEGSEMP